MRSKFSDGYGITFSISYWPWNSRESAGPMNWSVALHGQWCASLLVKRLITLRESGEAQIFLYRVQDSDKFSRSDDLFW